MNKWPKKCSVREYAERWYTRPCSKTVINQIKSGSLPGSQECAGGQWFVWVVNENLDPAYSYTAANDTSTGNSLADRILEKHRA